MLSGLFGCGIYLMTLGSHVLNSKCVSGDYDFKSQFRFVVSAFTRVKSCSLVLASSHFRVW